MPLYGSSRVGIRAYGGSKRRITPGSGGTVNPPPPLPPYGVTAANQTNTTGLLGERGIDRYELSNHLGNVLAVVSDYRRLASGRVSGSVGAMTTATLSAKEYYPFGLEVADASRNTSRSTTAYRYGFNGKEDDLTLGLGDVQDYGFRLYSRASGRFLSVDPLSESYPWNSVYSFAEGSPVAGVDLDGLERLTVTSSVDLVTGKTVFYIVKSEDYHVYVPSGLDNQPGRIIVNPEVQYVYGGQHADYLASQRQQFVKEVNARNLALYNAKAFEAQRNLESNPLYMVYQMSTAADAVDIAKTYSNEGATEAAMVAGIVFLPEVIGRLVAPLRRIRKASWGNRNTYGGARSADGDVIGGKQMTAMEHIAEGHYYNSRPNKPSSRFSEANSNPDRIKSMVDEAVAKGDFTTQVDKFGNKSHEITYKFDKQIGYDGGGRGTNTIRVYADGDGNVTTAYPIGK